MQKFKNTIDYELILVKIPDHNCENIVLSSVLITGAKFSKKEMDADLVKKKFISRVSSRLVSTRFIGSFICANFSKMRPLEVDEKLVTRFHLARRVSFRLCWLYRFLLRAQNF